MHFNNLTDEAVTLNCFFFLSISEGKEDDKCKYTNYGNATSHYATELASSSELLRQRLYYYCYCPQRLKVVLQVLQSNQRYSVQAHYLRSDS